MPAGEFVLDLPENPHPDLLALALDARRRARASDTNHAASAYYLGVLHACTKATGCDESEIVAWLDHHDTPAPTFPGQEWLTEKVIDAAVRARRIAHLGGVEQLPMYLYWEGMLDLLCLALDVGPDVVDGFVASCDPDPAPVIDRKPEPPVEVPVALPRNRVDPRST